MKLRALSLAGIAAALFAFPALAHHSFAMFDANRLVHLTGEVTGYEWINPHVWVHIAVEDEAGNSAVWSFEGGSTGQLTQTGWTAQTLQPGMEVEIGFRPMRDGSNGGQLLEASFEDGTYLCQGNECRERTNANNGVATPLSRDD